MDGQLEQFGEVLALRSCSRPMRAHRGERQRWAHPLPLLLVRQLMAATRGSTGADRVRL